MKTNFTKRLLGACRQVVLLCAMISAIGIANAGAQSCYTCTSGTNTTLDPATCIATVDVSSFMKSPCAAITYTISVEGVQDVPAASVNITAPGTYTYTIHGVDGDGNTNLCWGTFNVEDKSGPVCNVTAPVAGVVSTLSTKTVECNDASPLAAFDALTTADFTDCSDDIVRVYSVDESTSGCAVTANVLGTPLDGAFVAPAGTEICAIYKRTWYAVDGDGNVSEDACSQYVFAVRSTTVPTIPATVSVSCSDDLTALATTITPTIPTAATAGGTISLTNGVKVCKYIASLNEGTKLPTCGSGYKQINTWTVIDWCAGAIVAEGSQLVTVEDTEKPAVPTAGTVAFAASSFDCSGTITAAAATTTDNCSAALTWTTTITSTIGTGHAPGVGASTVLNTNGGDLAGVAIGSTVTVTWVAMDECGNQSDPITATFTGTTDNRGPVAICNDELNVSLVASNGTQQARVYAEDLDDTSRDNCSITNREVSLDGTTYGDYVTVDCSNIGTETVVYLRVTDAAGNTNVCWTDITVEDKSVPVVTVAGPLTINCLEAIPAVVDPVIVSQGCVAPTVVYNGETNVGISCGNDVITRTWTVTPPATGAHAGTDAYDLSQTITVVPATADWTATFPADDLSLTCDGANTIPEALKLEDILVDNSCNNWVYDVVDEEYAAGSDVCKKIVRTYTLINWCTVGNAGKPAATITGMVAEDDDNGEVGTSSVNLHTYGKFSYSQVFKISDSEAPAADIEAKASCNPADDCNGGVVTVTVSNTADNCGSATISSIVLTGEGVTSSASSDDAANGSASFTSLAKGTYTVSATIVDDCGNKTVKTATATVDGDCKKPTPVGVITFTALMENDSVDIWVSDIETSSYDNCTSQEDLVFGVELLTDTNGDGEFTIDDASATMPTDQVVILTCEKLDPAMPAMLALWAQDEAGNTQVVIIPIGFTDNDNSCNSLGGGAAADIAGNITNENNEDIDQVMVKFESSSQSLAQQLITGSFNYSVPMHTDLTITPEKDLGYMNGVTTADLVKLQRHILGISNLSSAYQMIAADVNSDEKVNTKDMLHISRLILGLYDELPNSTSWKFVAKNHQFSNPSSPWGFPQAIGYADLETSAQADFVGVKIGDLTGNAAPTQLLGSDDAKVGEMTIAIDETTLAAGQSTVVEFMAADFTDFAGYQFTISLGDNVKLAEVTPGVLPNMSEEANFGLNRLDEGTITTSWSNATGVTLEDGAVLFSLTLESTETVNLSDVLAINSKQTAAEAYNNDLDAHSVGVLFNRTETADFQLFQNQPNPFNGETMIGFNMPKAGVATLKVMNVAGQVLTTRSAEFIRGYNQIALSKSELNTSGVLYYQVETENFSATKKMVILE